MDAQVILVANISWPKTAKEDRTHDNEFMKQLAQSIETNGLLQPIGVRPDPNKANFFIGIFGEHRAGAFGKILKRDGIPAIVFDDVDEEEAAIMTDTENLWRNPLTKPQQARAMSRWHDHYNKKRAEYDAAVAAQKAATPKQKPGPKPKKTKPVSDQTGLETEATPAPVVTPPLPPKPPEATFSNHVAALTGQSPSTIKRLDKIGRAFTPAQMEVLEQQAVNQTWQDTIAGFEQAKRDAVVNLIASGLSEEDAIARASGTPEVTRADGKTYEVAPPASPGEKADADMGDEEWVRFHCSELIGRLEDPTPFLLHAILYRHTRDFRAAFKAKIKGLMADAKKALAHGGVYAVLNKAVTLSHPSKWLTCGPCTGTGIVTDGNKQKPCTACQGNAFQVRWEGK